MFSSQSKSKALTEAYMLRKATQFYFAFKREKLSETVPKNKVAVFFFSVSGDVPHLVFKTSYI